MVHITSKANSQEQATFVGNIGPGITNIDVNQQVNNNMAVHVGGKIYFMANTT